MQLLMISQSKLVSFQAGGGWGLRTMVKAVCTVM